MLNIEMETWTPMPIETLERWLADCELLARSPSMQFKMVTPDQPNAEWYRQRAAVLRDYLEKRRAARP